MPPSPPQGQSPWLPPPSPAQPGALAKVRAGGTGHWHWFHLPVSVFLLAFALANLAELAAWADLRSRAERQLEAAFGLGGSLAVPAIALMKGGALLLGLIALAGLLRRKDVWLMVAIAGWLAGTALFAVTAGLSGDVTELAVSVVFLVVFTVLLAVTYVLSVVQWRRNRRTVKGMSRTQEIALAAFARFRPPPGRPQGPPRFPS